jgi:peptidoglycan/LPS O-acetylase OafA/YrhL
MSPHLLERPAWIDRDRIPSLDGLRALAILLVLFAHAHQTRGSPDVPALYALGRRGAMGVDVFFVISGFLITTLMFREKDRTGRLALGAFYLRRLLRIVPAYAALLVVVAVLTALVATRMTGLEWLAALTWTVNFVRSPAWEVGHAW